MRRKILTYALSALAAVVIFASCSKEGSAGAAGPQGPAGAAGPQGPKGDPGTANVIYSEWLDVVFQNVNDTNTTTGVIDTIAWLADIPAPKIDQDILATGEIKVYMNAGSGDNPAVFPLPLFDAFRLTGIFNMNAYFTAGNISLYSTDDGSTFTDAGQTYYQYRYVIIPGGALALKPDNVNLDNYADVKKYLKLTN